MGSGVWVGKGSSKCQLSLGLEFCKGMKKHQARGSPLDFQKDWRCKRTEICSFVYVVFKSVHHSVVILCWVVFTGEGSFTQIHDPLNNLDLPGK